MEADEIGVVLSRASELRSKINNCIERASAQDEDDDISEGGSGTTTGKTSELVKVDEEQRRWLEMGGDMEVDSLINIRDALDSLEEQLACLQALQQQQRLERDATLAELDESRRILVKKLKEYRGKDLEVIQEACAFAGEPVEQRDDILLPPYGRRLPESFISSVHHYSPPLYSAHSARRRNVSAEHSFMTGNERQETENDDSAESKEEVSSQINNQNAKKLINGFGQIIGLTTKAVLVIASVISVLTLASFEPKLRRSVPSKLSEVLPRRMNIPSIQSKAHVPSECPPGKVLLIEDGIPRCFVKERVEVPFEPVVKAPDISYGCG